MFEKEDIDKFVYAVTARKNVIDCTVFHPAHNNRWWTSQSSALSARDHTSSSILSFDFQMTQSKRQTVWSLPKKSDLDYLGYERGA